MRRLTGGVGALAAAVGFLLFATAWRPWDLFERGPYTADFFDVQGRAIGRGGLAVPAEVAGIEGFTIGGDTHLYFGIVPAVVRIPLVVWGDAFDGRLGLLSMTVAVFVGALATARLCGHAARRTASPGTSLPAWFPDAAAAVFGLATPVLWLASRSLVYHEAELWGAALAVLGCERALVWYGSRRRSDLVVAGLVAVAALNTRASSGLAPALALVGLATVLAVRGRSWRVATGAVAWVAGAFGLYALVNAARFGSPLSVPFEDQVFTAVSEDRQEMLEATGGSFFSPRFVPTTLLQYLRPDAVRPDSLFPFLAWGPRATVVADAPFDTVDRAGSITATMPALVLAAFGVRWRRLDASWWVVLGACAAAVLPTLAIGYVAHRYLVDFVPLLVVLAGLGVPWWWERTWGRVLLGIGAAGGLFVALSLGVLAQRVYLAPEMATTAGFVETRYRLHDLYGGDPPPDLVRVESLPATGAEGTTAIVGDCDGVYVGTGTGWTRAELRSGGALHVVVSARPAPGPIVSGAAWQLELVEEDGGLRLLYVAGDLVREGELVVEGAPRDDMAEVELRITTDALTQGVDVRDDAGEALLDGFLLPAGGPLVAAPDWEVDRTSPELCDQLVGRLGSQ